ncbi:uncharacterized protein PV09_07320 [Verruconis gallopava]|uniref:Calcipressin n=1 Tax=Verruconis gallopava TaxID=253628 RepID=A0A0D1XGE8_9PEZI|nr:uncharacterized protein PV09_07320 [Verruconis gallopava]KIW01281.1 hypothetical protein PV09_07320 [Verruconis gallopava]
MTAEIMSSIPSALPALDTSTPPQSTISSRRGSRSPLSIDLSDLPPLITPSPPTNTLLITNLNDPVIFQPDNLQRIKEIVNQHVPIHTWAPLKSMRRIIVSFYSVDDATIIRQAIDGETVMDCRVRVYFGAETKISNEDQHLKAPHAEKQFFISPPPSPPHGWEMRNEDPPNKEVHAEDLAAALARLHARDARQDSIGDEHMDVEPSNAASGGSGLRMRSRSSTLVYHPEHAGDSPALPSISVEDTSESDHEADLSPMEDIRRPVVRTSRPPIELMEH